MKILHLHGGSLNGGAGKGLKNLSDSLNGIGVRSDIISIEDDGKYKKDIFLDKLLNSSCKIFYKTKEIFNPWFGSYYSDDVFDDYDIINIHWMNGKVISPKILSGNNRYVVTLRDMWPFTGGCHYSMDCISYESGCGNCKKINSNFDFDITSLSAKRKSSFFSDKITVVGISSWITNCAKNSYVMRNVKNFKTISNSIDINSFFIEEKIREKFTILIGAQNFSDGYKGFNDVFCAINKIAEKYKNIKILTFGQGDKKWSENIRCDVVCHGYLSDTAEMRRLYNTADVALFPSLYEAFGKTIAEAIACGTPVVSYMGSGPDDIIEHKNNGFLANRYSIEDLVDGLEFLMLNSIDRVKISNDIRSKFSPKNSALIYKDLYLDLINNE